MCSCPLPATASTPPSPTAPIQNDQSHCAATSSISPRVTPAAPASHKPNAAETPPPAQSPPSTPPPAPSTTSSPSSSAACGHPHPPSKSTESSGSPKHSPAQP